MTAPRLTRRDLLRAAAGAGMSGSALVAARLGLSAAPARAADGARGTLKLAHALEWGEKESLDPSSPTRMFPCVDLLYDCLVRRDEAGSPLPALATKWECDKSATRWTFHLRPKVKFHNGQILTARDVVTTLQHVCDPAVGSPNATALEIIDAAHMTAPDPGTVVIPLKRPHADFPVLMLHYGCSIVPAGGREAAAKSGIGTGPFRMETFAPDGTTVLIAHDDYWDGRPKVERIEVVGIADQDARLNALLAEQVDMLGTVSTAAADSLKKDARFSVQEFPTGTWLGITLRTDLSPFDKPDVRLAFKLAADRAGLVQTVLAGHGQVAADQPVWPGDPYALKLSVPHDPARAKALLARSGYPNGLDAVLNTSAAFDGMVPLAVAYKEMAAAAGIRLEVKQVAADSYWNTTWRKEPLCCSWWGERPADQVLNELYRPGAAWNETAFNDREFLEDLESARRELEIARRTRHYQSAEKILSERGGSLIPFFRNALRAVHNKVGGIEPSKQIFHWSDVSVKS